MKLAAHKVADWVSSFKASNAPALILVYGPDEGGVMETARRLRASYLGRDPDPLQYAQFDDAAFSGQPGLLADEAAAIPMFGDTKLVHVRGGAGKAPEAAKLYLAGLQDGERLASLVIIEAGSLRPAAALRKLAEGHAQAMALPCYLLEARDVARVARDYLESENYRIEAGALDLLTARLTTDRGLMQRDLEKLVLFKGPLGKDDATGMIGLDDVDAVLGNSAQASFDQLIDSVALGRVSKADSTLDLLFAGGTPADATLPAIRMHFQTLHLVLGLIESGTPQNAALSSFRPPLHFRRKPLVENQLRLWSRRKASRALSLLQEAEAACRGASRPLAHAKAGQVLLRISRAAQR
jgi:DNA polymerase-3 subunit delta